MINLDGFSVIRYDRICGYKTSGVCTYIIRSNFKLKVISKSRGTLESLCIEMLLPLESVLIECVYNPPRCVNFSSLPSSLQKMCPLYENINIAGDFNVYQLYDS